jgi:hypothetical protein
LRLKKGSPLKKILLLLLALSLSLFATPFATINKVKGTAKVQHPGSIKKSKVKAGAALAAGDTLLTYRNAKVVLTMKDKTKIVVNEYAKLELLSEDEFSQSGGKVFFKVTKRKSGKGLKVKTPFAIIGVKGTQFVVTDSDKDKSLALNEGLVGVDSPTGDKFAVLDKDKLDAAMGSSGPNAEMAEFEKYKKDLMAEFTEYVKSFDLKPGKKLSFDGKNVTYQSMNDSDNQMFKTFMSDAEFKAVSDELENMESEMGSGKDQFSDKFFDAE